VRSAERGEQGRRQIGSHPDAEARANTGRSDVQDHDFRRLDQGGDGLALLEAHFTYGIRGNDRGNALATDGKRDLRHQPHGLDLRDAADELISSTDFAEVGPSLAHVTGLGCSVKKLIDLLFWDPMVAAGGFDGTNLSLVDPLFKRGIADAKDLGGFARRK
jgi:hypothetical protein